MNENEKKIILQELESRIGSDITDLDQVYEVDKQVALKISKVQSLLNVANNEVPSKLSAAIKKAEKNSQQIEEFRIKREMYESKVNTFLNKIHSFSDELYDQFSNIHKMEEAIVYLQSYEKIEDISSQLSQCNDDEQAVLLYGELKAMSLQFLMGHRADYIQECTRYWHNILKDKLSKQYEDQLKLLKWPLTAATLEASPPPKDVLNKFCNLTRYLLLVEEPKYVKDSETGNWSISEELSQDAEPCLPVRMLLLPLKKRFAFHFSTPRQTARVDRPEWFLTLTLTWIKDHQGFLRKYLQPIADGLEKRHIQFEEEFNAGLVTLAAKRLHTVLGVFEFPSLQNVVEDVDAAFAHTVDETLGFHKELTAVIGKETNSLLNVLTEATIFEQWLGVEKKYALAKMDEILSEPSWMEPVALAGAACREPRGAHLFITLLATIEQRYSSLPTPGHKLQFVELQQELVEEWRVRLTQLLGAAAGALHERSFTGAPGRAPHALSAVVNAAHHTRTVLLQWAHSLHYLQLHFYRREFEEFKQSQQHHEDNVSSLNRRPSHFPRRLDGDSKNGGDKNGGSESVSGGGGGVVGDEDALAAILEEHTADREEDEEMCETMSLKDVEVQAQKLALSEAARGSGPAAPEAAHDDVLSPLASLILDSAAPEPEDAGVWAEAPALLARLRDAGLAALADHMLLEFKAKLRDYRRQKWHAMPVLEPTSLCISAALCQPLGGLCARLHAAAAELAGPLAARLRSHAAAQLDRHLCEEVVLQSWWSAGGSQQLEHDVVRNLLPAFAPPSRVATTINMFPRLKEACQLLKMELEPATRLRKELQKQIKQTHPNTDSLAAIGIRHLPPTEVLQILQQRTDLGEQALPSVMELF